MATLLQVDGHTLLQLDDQMLRYELDIGALVVRETLMRIIDQLHKAPATKAPIDDEPLQQAMSTSRRGRGKNGYDRVGVKDDEDSDDDEDDEEDDGGITFFGSKASTGPETEEQAERRRKRIAHHKEVEIRMLVRVLACVSALTVLYSILSQSLQNWHSRMVTMRGEGERLSFSTNMGLWSFSSEGHYHNDNMYAHIMPNSEGFGWTDDYSVSDTYDHSKWQCKPPSNKTIKDFCSFIRAAQACSILTMICCLVVLIHSMVGVSYGRPMGCSRVMAVVSMAQCAFSIAALLCADGAFTEQLRRYGDEDITAGKCKTHYLSYAKEADDDW